MKVVRYSKLAWILATFMDKFIMDFRRAYIHEYCIAGIIDGILI